MIEQSKIFEVFQDYKRLYTQNLVPGQCVYGESLVRQNAIEYREWNPRRSKLAAAVLCGVSNVGIRKNNTVLYLGASSGTTVSHVSDMIGSEGMIFAVEIAPEMMRSLVFLAKERLNIAPVLASASHPETYEKRIVPVDIVYQDIAQRDQAAIFIKNLQFLKKGGYAILVVKTRSIDITTKPKAVFDDIRRQVEKHIKIIDGRSLEPYQKGHYILICKTSQYEKQ